MESRGREKAGTSPARAGLPSAGLEYSPPYRWAGFVGLGIFLLYVITLAPTTAFWDTSEYIATGHILGIPHPPGNPVFVLLARAWEVLLTPLPLSVAVKINLFSAANGAAAAAFWFLVAHRVLAFFSPNEFFRRTGAMAATLISATAFTVWNQSVVNEKVYTVSLMTIALLTWLIFRWRDNLGRGKDDNLIILIVFLLALSLGNHLMAFLVAFAMVLFVIWVHPRALLRWQLYTFAALAWILGLSAQLFLPIRADSRPVISEGDPRCESVIDATLDILRLHPPLSWTGPDAANDKCALLASSLRREQYRKPPLNVNPIYYPRDVPRDLRLIRWQFVNYAQYFDWQWARSLDGSNTFFAFLRAPFTTRPTEYRGSTSPRCSRRFASFSFSISTSSMAIRSPQGSTPARASPFLFRATGARSANATTSLSFRFPSGASGPALDWRPCGNAWPSAWAGELPA
jgi:hypothetical protein